MKIKPLNGRDGRFSTGRSTANPYRDRAVDVQGKCLTERARHPFDRCRGTAATVTGGSPILSIVKPASANSCTTATHPRKTTPAEDVVRYQSLQITLGISYRRLTFSQQFSRSGQPQILNVLNLP
ncbi:hypothetical protein C8J57DRAFT_1523199 [Mycena rebaudengoi]|nr:hypothetical protein C8J57DRAFT_1523199 [Mycena rebaudengoi]